MVSRQVKQSQAPDWDYDETKKRILSIPRFHFKAFAVISYVAGLRINETRAILRNNIRPKVISNGETRIIIGTLNEKNPHRAYKEMPLNPIMEKDYFDVIDEWWDQSDGIQKPFSEYCERYYRQMMRVYLNIHPHALRHLRVHHVDDQSIPGMKALTPRQYQDYFGWETIETSSKYQSRTRTMDLSEKF